MSHRTPNATAVSPTQRRIDEILVPATRHPSPPTARRTTTASPLAPRNTAIPPRAYPMASLAESQQKAQLLTAEVERLKKKLAARDQRIEYLLGEVRRLRNGEAMASLSPIVTVGDYQQIEEADSFFSSLMSEAHTLELFE